MSPEQTNPLADPDHEEAPLGQLGTLLAEGTAARTIGGGGTTSDLSLDEILLLHSIGLAPAQVAFGVGCVSIPYQSFTWSNGPVHAAEAAFMSAFAQAKSDLRRQASGARAAGVVGVEVELRLHGHYVLVALTGTAVAPIADASGHSQFKVRYQSPFLCDLSARDFAVLSSAGWYPCDLVAGASYVHAPRRSMGTALGQATQNVELTAMTGTLYEARERAMELLQRGIIAAKGTGLVDAKIIDRPVRFAPHVIEFAIWGTAIVMIGAEHRHPRIEVVVPLDERKRDFEATSLD